MQITTNKKAIATKLDWNGVGEPTVWFSVGGMGDRIPIVVTKDEMHAIAMGQRKARLEITVTIIDENAKAESLAGREKGNMKFNASLVNRWWLHAAAALGVLGFFAGFTGHPAAWAMWVVASMAWIWKTIPSQRR